mmetsp:Transcript_17887/g.51247  ORF Transcript_17887/g.51247 Transcript_17887/m.51247 type:complete len:229 (+) Transcript_17887:176-862(+)
MSSLRSSSTTMAPRTTPCAPFVWVPSVSSSTDRRVTSSMDSSIPSSPEPSPSLSLRRSSSTKQCGTPSSDACSLVTSAPSKERAGISMLPKSRPISRRPSWEVGPFGSLPTPSTSPSSPHLSVFFTSTRSRSDTIFSSRSLATRRLTMEKRRRRSKPLTRCQIFLAGRVGGGAETKLVAYNQAIRVSAVVAVAVTGVLHCFLWFALSMVVLAVGSNVSRWRFALRILA